MNAPARPHRNPPPHRRGHGSARLPRREQGAALIIALMLLAIVMVLASTGWQMATQEERMVGQQRDRTIAFEAAEAALRDGERDLLGVCAVGIDTGNCAPRTEPINGETGFGNAGAEGTCSTTGLCLGLTSERPDFTTRNVLAVLRGDADAVGQPVSYGQYTRPNGARAINGPGGQPLPWQPRYVIESLCYGGGGQGMAGTFVASCPSPIYRITAMARGMRQTDTTSGDEAAEVILQSFYSLGN